MDTAQKTIQNPYTPIADRWRNATKDWKRDAAKQATIAGAEFDADLALLDYQNQYNDPTQQAERMRSAGLNPDLVGLDGVSDSAGMSGVTGSAGIDTGPSSMEKAQFWLSNGQNIFNSALQLADQFQSMRGRSLDNDIKNLEYVKLLQGVNDDAVSRSYLGSLEQLLFSSKEDLPYLQDLSKFDFIPSGISKRNKKRLTRLMPSIDSYTKGIQSLGGYYDSLLSSSESAAIARERSGKKEGSIDMQDLVSGYSKVAKFLEKVQEYAARQDAAQAKYNADYYENSNGAEDATIDADMRKTARDSAKDSYEASKGDKELNKFFSELVMGLRKDDNWYSNILLTILYGMKSGAFQRGVDLYNSVRPTRVKPKSR